MNSTNRLFCFFPYTYYIFFLDTFQKKNSKRFFFAWDHFSEIHHYVKLLRVRNSAMKVRKLKNLHVNRFAIDYFCYDLFNKPPLKSQGHPCQLISNSKKRSNFLILFAGSYFRDHFVFFDLIDLFQIIKIVLTVSSLWSWLTNAVYRQSGICCDGIILYSGCVSYTV